MNHLGQRAAAIVSGVRAAWFHPARLTTSEAGSVDNGAGATAAAAADMRDSPGALRWPSTAVHAWRGALKRARGLLAKVLNPAERHVANVVASQLRASAPLSSTSDALLRSKVEAILDECERAAPAHLELGDAFRLRSALHAANRMVCDLPEADPSRSALAKRLDHAFVQMGAHVAGVSARARDAIRERRYGPAELAADLAGAADNGERRLIVEQLLNVGVLPERETTHEPWMARLEHSDPQWLLEMNRLRPLTADDVFYDFGSGDGFVTNLVGAWSDAKVKGIEIDPAYCRRGAERAEELGLGGVTHICAEASTVDVSDGTVFYQFNPFRARYGGEASAAIHERVLDNIRKAALHHEVYVVLAHVRPDPSEAPWLQRVHGEWPLFIYRADQTTVRAWEAERTQLLEHAFRDGNGDDAAEALEVIAKARLRGLDAPIEAMCRRVEPEDLAWIPVFALTELGYGPILARLAARAETPPDVIETWRAELSEAPASCAADELVAACSARLQGHIGSNVSLPVAGAEAP